MLKIAINGFGRIGKTFLRNLFARKSALDQIEIVAINLGPNGDLAATAHDFQYDSIMGTFEGSVRLDHDNLIIDGKKIKLFSKKDPKEMNWGQYKIDLVVDSSGKFTNRENARQHIDAGAKKVLITAPAQDDDVTIIPGVNQEMYDVKKHNIISLGSCTTNAFFPMLKVLDDAFKIKGAFMSTIHAYTNSQALLDVDASSKDLRKNRAAALNVIPTTTGAMSVIGKVLPNLNGKVKATSLRVPVPIVSLIDMVVEVDSDVTAQVVNKKFEDLAKGKFKNIINVNYADLVSSDFKGNSHSVIIDANLTDVLAPNTIKLLGWYDNEWGYSNRLIDFLLLSVMH